MKLFYKKSDIIKGAVIYSLGDTTAAIILGQFSLLRFLGIILLGSTLYAFEVPNYFAWIDKKVPTVKNLYDSLKRTLLAILYFNPLWITRHLFFLNLFKQNYSAINSGLFKISIYSFLANVPVSIVMNYLIQNKIPLKWRFFASAAFSAVMVVYYALSEGIFK